MIETGSCLCGSVSYSFQRNKVISGHHCHCKDCQKATGSGKATILVLAKKNLVIKGNPKFYETVGSGHSGAIAFIFSILISYFLQNNLLPEGNL